MRNNKTIKFQSDTKLLQKNNFTPNHLYNKNIHQSSVILKGSISRNKDIKVNLRSSSSINQKLKISQKNFNSKQKSVSNKVKLFLI